MSTGSPFRWQWTLANGGTVTAVIDPSTNVETVSQGSRVLSQSARGAKPDGHLVVVASERAEGASERPPIEALLTFAPSAPICILRVDGYEVAPALWPTRQRPTPPRPDRPYGTYVFVSLAAIALLIAGTWIRSLRQDPAPRDEGKLGGTHRSMNGLFVAHYPEDLEARLAVLPPGVTGVALEDKAKSMTIVLAALTFGPEDSRDPWALQQRLRDEALANLAKGAGKYEESSRRDEPCLGKSGAVVLGQIMHHGARQARIWSCAFAYDGAGYLALTMLAEPASITDERRVRAIVDATELTHLADLGAVPSPSGASSLLGADPH
jgi:hypothetical protein